VSGGPAMPAAGHGPVRTGVIGTGRIGRMHAELLATSVPGASLAAVSDAVMPLAEEVGQALGVPALETPSLIGHPEIDAVAICAPTDTHVPLLMAAAEAGQAVFCEKPISLDLAEVDRALAVVARVGTPLMVGFNRRFDASHAAVRDAVVGGSLGPPHVVRITSRDPGPPPMAYARASGGIFLDMTIHDFDMARFVVGSEVVEVFATGAVRIVPELAEIGDVDTAVVTLWHENECITVIDNSRRATYGYDQRIEVLGADAMAASENPLVNTALTRDADGTRLATLPYFFIERYTASYVRQWQAFVAAYKARESPPTSGHDGRAALVLGLAAKRSLIERRPVRLTEVDGLPKVSA
jgi:myo-inositol 2-dehydrogenase/D-chiro-inositol 1-dehydrogenase